MGDRWSGTNLAQLQGERHAYRMIVVRTNGFESLAGLSDPKGVTLAGEWIDASALEAGVRAHSPPPSGGS